MVDLKAFQILERIVRVSDTSSMGDVRCRDYVWEGFENIYGSLDTTRLPKIRNNQAFLYMIKKQLPKKEVQYGRQ